MTDFGDTGVYIICSISRYTSIYENLAVFRPRLTVIFAMTMVIVSMSVLALLNIVTVSVSVSVCLVMRRFHCLHGTIRSLLLGLHAPPENARLGT